MVQMYLEIRYLEFAIRYKVVYSYVHLLILSMHDNLKMLKID